MVKRLHLLIFDDDDDGDDNDDSFDDDDDDAEDDKETGVVKSVAFADMHTTSSFTLPSSPLQLR